MSPNAHALSREEIKDWKNRKSEKQRLKEIELRMMLV